MPVISANTQARHEGDFRLEWALAAERGKLVAETIPFILPVVRPCERKRCARAGVVLARAVESIGRWRDAAGVGGAHGAIDSGFPETRTRPAVKTSLIF